MDFFKLTLTALSSITVLFFLTKIMGDKQMSELSMFDYIIGISIGSIAAEMATELEEFWKPLTAMIIYAGVSLIFSFLCNKSIVFRRFGFGKTLILYKSGKIYRENLKKAHIDISELLVSCRTNGYFDLNELSCILLEPNGKLSFLPFAAKRPLNPSDMQIVPKEDTLLYNVIIDGKIMRRNLIAAGHNENWLKIQLRSQSIKDVKSVSLAVCDRNSLYVFRRNDIKKSEDIFE